MATAYDLEKQESLPDHRSSLEGNQEFPRAIQTTSHQSFRHDRDNIYINDVPIDKREFVTAFGGAMEVGARAKTSELRDYANPVPAGLAAFSASVMSLGLITMQARSVTHSNVLLVAFLTTSGVVELIVGVLCFVVGNTWAACTFLMFGGFWSSYSFLLMDVGNIAASYDSVHEYNQAVAFYFLPWCIFSFCLWLCTLKSTLALSSLMFSIWFWILLLTIATFVNSVNVFKAGGFFLIFSGILGFYNMYAGFADSTNSYVIAKPFLLPNAATEPAEEN